MFDISTKSNKDDDFLSILENGPTISKKEADEGEQQIKKGYKAWNITEF